MRAGRCELLEALAAVGDAVVSKKAAALLAKLPPEHPVP